MMQLRGIQRCGLIIWLAFGLGGLPQAAAAQAGPAGASNAAWAAKISSALKLNPSQQAALQDFLSASARSGLVTGASAEQVRAMSLLQRFDYWADQMATVAANDRSNAAALHRFYSTLSPEQQKLFDDATKGREPHMSVAADPMPLPGTEAPDYRLPSHKEADWLIKPTGENIARVYPSAAMKEHVPGQVILGCTADVDGYLSDCIVKSEEPKDRGFGNAALEVTAYMRMQPATDYGVPVRSQVNVPIRFQLDDEK
jgi:TonB family protein